MSEAVSCRFVAAETTTPSFMQKTFVDFFAGIGLFSLGLERAGWQPVYAVDYDSKKQAMYEGHFGPSAHYRLQDISTLRAEDVPTTALAHASFPCTDLSLAGAREGLKGKGSSAFWSFVRVLGEMGCRRPEVVTLENVPGFVTSHGGKDFEAALLALNELGYTVDAVLLDAAHFAPQSRQRLFVIGVQRGYRVASPFRNERILSVNDSLRHGKLSAFIRSHPHVDWNLRELPAPPPRRSDLASIVDTDEDGWWERDRVRYLLSQMSARHAEVVARMTAGESWSYGTVFRRMRKRDGKRRSTAELRSDGLAGCLRTPKGGSAKQILLRAGKGRVDARLLNGRECARLMGVEEYRIAPHLSLNDVLFGFGDAVCVPAVEWIATHYLNPLVEEERTVVTFEEASEFEIV